MKTKFRSPILLGAVLGFCLASTTQTSRAATSVVTSIPELAEITKQVGGAQVTVYSIARANNDYHAIEPRPSDVQRIARAALDGRPDACRQQ